MPDSIAGLPLHPLLVHATVVIIPAAAFAVLLAAVWSRFRRWAGFLPLGLAVVVPVVISVLAVAAALGTSVQVVLIGHSGAKAAWSQVEVQSSRSLVGVG